MSSFSRVRRSRRLMDEGSRSGETRPVFLAVRAQLGTRWDGNGWDRTGRSEEPETRKARTSTAGEGNCAGQCWRVPTGLSRLGTDRYT